MKNEYGNQGGEESDYPISVELLEGFDLTGSTRESAKGNSSYKHFFLLHFLSPFLSGFYFKNEEMIFCFPFCLVDLEICAKIYLVVN